MDITYQNTRVESKSLFYDVTQSQYTIIFITAIYVYTTYPYTYIQRIFYRKQPEIDTQFYITYDGGDNTQHILKVVWNYRTTFVESMLHRHPPPFSLSPPPRSFCICNCVIISALCSLIPCISYIINICCNLNWYSNFMFMRNEWIFYLIFDFMSWTGTDTIVCNFFTGVVPMNTRMPHIAQKISNYSLTRSRIQNDTVNTLCNRFAYHSPVGL